MNNNLSTVYKDSDKIKESPDSTRLPDGCTRQQKDSKVRLVKVPRFSPKTVKIIEIVVLVIALCATVLLFSASIVFHYVSVS